MSWTHEKNVCRLGSAIFILCSSACSIQSAGETVAETTSGVTTPSVSINTGPGSSGGGSGLHPWAPTAHVGISTPRHGEPLYGYPTPSSWYDPTTDTIEITGAVSGVPLDAFSSGRAVLLINGGIGVLGIQQQPMPDAQGLSFTARLTTVEDPLWVMRGLLVEVVDTFRDEVVAREYTSFFDLRMTPEATPYADKDLRIDGLGAQLTDYGLGATGTPDALSSLEVPHLYSLPHPGLAEFNAQLAAAADASEVYDSGAKGLDACIDFADAVELAPELTSLGEWHGPTGAITVARVYQQIYEAARDNSEICSQAAGALSFASFGVTLAVAATCELAMQNWCVKRRPKIDDFELCVDRMVGDPKSLTIESISDVSLSFGQTPTSGKGARIKSDAEVVGLRGRVNGHLRDLSIRWKDGTCIGRPVAEIGAGTITKEPWLATWTTCFDLEVDADGASTSPDGRNAVFDVERAADREQLEVRQLQDARFVFNDDRRIDIRKGVCAEPFISDHAETLAESFYPQFERVLNQTWNAGGADTQQAQALELLLSRFEIGKVELGTHQLDARLEPLRSSTLEGMGLVWRTLVEPQGDSLPPLTPNWFHHPAASPPWYSPDAEDSAGNPSDFSYTLTTGYLNQTLHALAPTYLLMELEPSWSDLELSGMTAGRAGQPKSDTPRLDGTLLSQLSPMFAELGSRQIEIYVRPTLDPITWMNPDPPAIGETPFGTKLAYGIAGLEVTFVEPEVRGEKGKILVPAKEWLRVVLDFRDTNFSIDFSAHDDDFLAVSWNEDDWWAAVEYSAFSSCRPVAHGVLEPSNPCERDLERALTKFLTERLAPRFLQMLSRLPAPQFWDAAGETSRPVRTSRVRRHQMGQNVTLFGEIPDGP